MNLLIFPEYGYPANHAVVNTVYEDLLPSRGHVVHMIRPMAGVEEPQRVPAPWGNGSMLVYPDQPTAGPIGNLVRAVRRARWIGRALRELEPVPIDAILVRNDLVSAFAAASEARRRGIPFVFQISSPDAEFMMSRGRERGGVEGMYLRLRGRAGLAARRRVSRRATAVLAISASMRDYLVAEDGLNPERVFSFPMGVVDGSDIPSEGVEALRRRLNLPADRTVVFAGSLDAVRQPRWMLDTFDIVRARVSDAVLLVLTYNAGEPRRAFEAEARRRGADVRIAGPVPIREMTAYLQCGDVVIAPYPPRMEHKVASPTKSIEGLFAGRPVVGSAEVDSHTVILQESGGGVCVPWDKQRFADAVVSLLEQPERRRQMGEQGRQWAQTHRTYSHLTEYLERILEASRSPAALRALPHAP
jgi:glycosyltransferase involved in cell wall biosynthesis